MQTFIDFHIRDHLPFIHSHKPSIILPPATKINDKLLLVSIKGCEYRVETFLRELAGREEERSYNDLLLQSASIRQHPNSRLTLSAPHSIHCFAFWSVIPPPTCRPPGHAANASRAASSFPGPSIITCAPSSPLSL
jgi:hypothetical protein